MEKKKKQPNKLMTAQVEVVETNKTEKYGDLFIIVQKNDEVRIAVTDKIVSSLVFKSIDEAKKYIDSKPWELIVNTTIVIYNITKSFEEAKS